MAYKWKPSKSARAAFAEKMKDPNEQAAYNQRATDRVNKKRSSSKFDYNTAGGNYIPTRFQYDNAMRILLSYNITKEEVSALNQVVSAYSLNETTHHDNIHIINELVRSGK